MDTLKVRDLLAPLKAPEQRDPLELASRLRQYISGVMRNAVQYGQIDRPGGLCRHPQGPAPGPGGFLCESCWLRASSSLLGLLFLQLLKGGLSVRNLPLAHLFDDCHVTVSQNEGRDGGATKPGAQAWKVRGRRRAIRVLHALT
ncbi:hypothetical protein Pres01_29690 [Metapseudomonas resinovorans]|nr:hypothetical protein [Pseudomonas resinovorans]GLZ86918.1 hypothetical protein Pres01_29690 [Pseudomonas resinovorans]